MEVQRACHLRDDGTFDGGLKLSRYLSGAVDPRRPLAYCFGKHDSFFFRGWCWMLCSAAMLNALCMNMEGKKVRKKA